MKQQLFLLLVSAGLLSAQYEMVVVGGQRSSRTMRPQVRGTEYAAVAMKPHAALAAERILRAGGNAFDAIVGGQAVLGLVEPASNGVGSDTVLLVYDAKTKKVYSVNGEGTAPKLATIEWYRKNQDGKIPVDDGLLAGTVPGVIDAWYLLLSRWGTKSFGEVLAPAIELAEKGFPGLSRTATRAVFGAISRSSSRRLPSNSLASVANPVTLPPGIAKAVMRPDPTGSPTPTMMIGRPLALRCAANVPGVPPVTMRSTGSFARSAASCGRLSFLPSAQTALSMRFLPST